MLLTQYKKYSATITLSGFEIMGTNNMVASELRQAGFTNVEVTGSGKQRQATGVWSGETQEVKDLPKQVSNIIEV